MADIGRSIKGAQISFHTIGAIFKYGKDNIASILKNRKKEFDNKNINIDKFNISGTINSIKNSVDIIYKNGTDKALDELYKTYVHAGELLNKLDKKLMSIKSEEEFEKIKDQLENEYKKVLKYINDNINNAKELVQKDYIHPSDIDKAKNKISSYIERIFSLTKNSKNFRGLSKEDFQLNFNFDASKLYDLYKSIPYNNINQIPIFSNILNNIKIGMKDIKTKIIESTQNPIIINEGLINKSKSKPFKGKFSNLKLVIRNRGTKDVDYDKLVKYIQSTILPDLDYIITKVAEKSVPLIYRSNKQKWIDKVFKSCRSIILSKELTGDRFYLKTHCMSDGDTEITFKGDISDSGNMDFKLYDVVTTTYMVV